MFSRACGSCACVLSVFGFCLAIYHNCNAIVRMGRLDGFTQAGIRKRKETLENIRGVRGPLVDPYLVSSHGQCGRTGQFFTSHTIRRLPQPEPSSSVTHIVMRSVLRLLDTSSRLRMALHRSMSTEIANPRYIRGTTGVGYIYPAGS